jgi:pyrroloquinoline quinone biosynthesis protein D
MNTALRPKLASHVRLKIDAPTGDPVLLYPEGVLILNSAAHEIAQRCTGEKTVAEIVSALAEEFDAPEDVLRADVFENLEDLRQKNLLLFLE